MPEGLRVGTSVFWREAGEAERRALLVHCSLAHSGAWSGVMARLADRLRMTAFDMPGHGRSGDWTGGDFQAETVAIAATFCDGRTDLVGHSFGATVALRLALERPELVRSLVLIEPVLFALVERTPEHRALRDALAPYRAALERGDSEAAARVFNAVWGAAPWEALGAAQREATVARIGLIEAAAPALDHDNGGVLAPGRIEAIGVPVLLIEGGDSPPVVAAIHARLAERLRGVSRVSVPGARHMVPVSHPEPVAAAIRGFLPD